MKLSVSAINQFQCAWHESFGEEIDFEKAEFEAMNLLNTHCLLLNNLNETPYGQLAQR